jgi:hypothetical protein
VRGQDDLARTRCCQLLNGLFGAGTSQSVGDRRHAFLTLEERLGEGQSGIERTPHHAVDPSARSTSQRSVTSIVGVDELGTGRDLLLMEEDTRHVTGFPLQISFTTVACVISPEKAGKTGEGLDERGGEARFEGKRFCVTVVQICAVKDLGLLHALFRQPSHQGLAGCCLHELALGGRPP